jgi:methylmalonyl-CoA mutase cobalamin-binding subunit
VARLPAADRESIANAKLRACIATTDVHEYGKILIETVLAKLGVEIVDGGTSTDPNDLAQRAENSGADFIALSSYNGVALQFVAALKQDLKQRDLILPVFIGGKLNRVPDGSNTSLPVDVTREITETGAIVCPTVEAMVAKLVDRARQAP